MADPPQGHSQDRNPGAAPPAPHLRFPLTGCEIRFRKPRRAEVEAQIELGKLLAVAAGRQPDSEVTVAGLLDEYLPGAVA